MRYSNPVHRYTEERESVDRRLDRLLETIRGELEKSSLDDYKRLITNRKRRARRKAKA